MAGPDSGFHNKEFLQLSVEHFRQLPYEFSASSALRNDMVACNRIDKSNKGGAATDFVKK